MDYNQLLAIRSKIVQQAQSIALQGKGDARDRLEVILNLVRGNETLDERLFSTAIDLVSQIDNDDDKLGVLLDLLYEVDVKISSFEKKPDSDGGREDEGINQEG